MDKFYRLERYLKNQSKDSFSLTFKEIEEILGFKMAYSAYTYEVYWKPSQTHTFANAVLRCGYEMKPYLLAEYTVFTKIGKTPINYVKQVVEKDNYSSYKANDFKANISKYVDKFTNIYHSDSNGRYMSYDHIRSAFLKYRKDESKRDLITLYLYAYLASWGMLRNSFLMQKDYLFSRPVVDVLCSDKYDSLLEFNPFGSVTNKQINLIIELSNDIRRCYLGKTYYGEGESGLKTIDSITDTLVSKIILGTIGCTVAYDRYVKAGLSSYNLTQRISNKSIHELCRFAKANEEEIKKEISKLNDLYTPMKIIDMFFFEKGFEV